jgi:hydroxyacylglutathione hydrolase
VLTHGHTDHAGSVNAVARAGVPIAIGADDAGLLERGVNEQLPVTGFPGRILGPVITRMTFAGASPQVLVRESLRLDAYGIGAAMVPVPGHTGGSCVVLLDDGDAIVGDLVRGGFAFARIRVNLVSPGVIESAALGRRLQQLADENNTDIATARNRIRLKLRHPTGTCRVG